MKGINLEIKLKDIKRIKTPKYIKRRYGRVVNGFKLLERVGVRKGTASSVWKAICPSCKKEKILTYDHISCKGMKSCGCGYKSKMGLAKTKIYHAWTDIKEGCYNKNSYEYAYYGSKGIHMCRAWMDFEKFVRWAMENGYRDHTTLTRKDRSKNFTPSNCYWREHKKLAVGGRVKYVSEWVEQYNLSRRVLKYRVFKEWSSSRMLSPVRTQAKMSKREQDIKKIKRVLMEMNRTV
jgi:hypothetical protein